MTFSGRVPLSSSSVSEGRWYFWVSSEPCAIFSWCWLELRRVLILARSKIWGGRWFVNYTGTAAPSCRIIPRILGRKGESQYYNRWSQGAGQVKAKWHPSDPLNQWSRTIYWFTIGIVQPHKIAYKLYMVKSRLVDMWEAWAVCGSMCSLQSVLKGNFFVRTYWEVKVKSVGTYFEEYSATCRHNKTSWISCCLRQADS